MELEEWKVEPYQQLALQFSEILTEELGVATVIDICHANDKLSSDQCASHDYVDANMLMAEAFCLVVGRDVDLQNQQDVELWNKAWDHAKVEDFFVDWGDLYAYHNRV
jgi:hypothetical protein